MWVLVKKVHFVSRDILEGRKVRHKILYVGVRGPGTVDAVVLEEFDRGVDVSPDWRRDVRSFATTP